MSVFRTMSDDFERKKFEGITFVFYTRQKIRTMQGNFAKVFWSQIVESD